MEIPFSRNIPVRYQADIAVIGGGIAGVCAAVTAAKQGKRVILVERFGVPGGNATSGGVGAFCGETAGQGEVFDEIISWLERFEAIVPYRPYEECEHRLFAHELLAVILQEMLLSHGVKLLLHTRLADCLIRDGRVTSVILAGASGLEALSADVFIDASGEAALVAAAGFETKKGRDGDHAQLPMSLMFFIRNVAADVPVPPLPEDFLERFRSEAELPMTSIWPDGPWEHGASGGSYGNAIKVKVPLGDATDTESLTQAEIRARRTMLKVIDFYRREKKMPWRLDHASPCIGIREGRRAVGDYVLTVDDLRAGRRFDDAIARGVFYLDGHSPDDDKRTYILPKDSLGVPPYQIPLRTLLVKDAKNVLVAGRCFSAEQLALSSARVMTTCAMLGQAAGMVAARAADDHAQADIRRIDPLEIRTEVERHGAKL